MFSNKLDNLIWVLFPLVNFPLFSSEWGRFKKIRRVWAYEMSPSSETNMSVASHWRPTYLCVNVCVCILWYMYGWKGRCSDWDSWLTSLGSDIKWQVRRKEALDTQTMKTKGCFTFHQEELRWWNWWVTWQQALHIQILQFLKVFGMLNFPPLLILIMIALSISKTLFIFKALYEHYLIN